MPCPRLPPNPLSSTQAPHTRIRISPLHSLRSPYSDIDRRVDLMRMADYVALVEVFHSALARHLPALKVVIIHMPDDIRRMYLHPRFNNPRLQLHAVTTLELKLIPFFETWELDRLLMPFPSLRILDMYRTFWVPRDKRQAGSRWPDMLKTVPPKLIDLRIGLRGDEWGVRTLMILIERAPCTNFILQYVLTGAFNLVGYDRLLYAVSSTLQVLSLNMPVTRALIKTPRWNDVSNIHILPALLKVHLTLDCPVREAIRPTTPVFFIIYSRNSPAFSSHRSREATHACPDIGPQIDQCRARAVP
ncbi:hypothetical protein BD310DRAFT_935647 [Dichomitus squalens]|uniref:Uncharacterized protein n=1 Tax=Dichomitus squalens TaxID=114155 RepID=A0A4Q9PK97_9APHY|nr:hypothetical protein BD310DRAFT_935647 [Dichomitus squalens]